MDNTGTQLRLIRVKKYGLLEILQIIHTPISEVLVVAVSWCGVESILLHWSELIVIESSIVSPDFTVEWRVVSTAMSKFHSVGLSTSDTWCWIFIFDLFLPLYYLVFSSHIFVKDIKRW